MPKIRSETGEEIEILSPIAEQVEEEISLKERQRRDELIRTRETLRPLIEGLKIGDIVQAFNKATKDLSEDHKLALESTLEELRETFEGDISVTDEGTAKGLTTLADAIRQWVNQQKNEKIVALAKGTVVETDIDLAPIEKLATQLEGLVEALQPKDGPQEVTVDDWQPLADLLGGVINERMTDPDDPRDYINVRLSNGKKFYTGLSKSFGAASAQPIQFQGSDGKGSIVTSLNPLPVTFGEDITVNVGTSVEISNDEGNPVPISGTVDTGLTGLAQDNTLIDGTQVTGLWVGGAIVDENNPLPITGSISAESAPTFKIDPSSGPETPKFGKVDAEGVVFVRDDYTDDEILADQTGAGAELEFEFTGGDVQMVVIRCDDGGRAVFKEADTASASFGVDCPEGEPIYVPRITSLVKVYAATGAVKVYGLRR